MDTNFDELDSLFLDWESGAIDEQGMQRLREILKSSPDARKHFLKMQSLSAALKLEDGAGLVAGIGRDERTPAASVVDSPSTDSQRSLQMPRWFAATAAVVACLLGGRLAYLQYTSHRDTSSKLANVDPSPRRENQEPTSTGIAVVTRIVDIVWSPGQNPYEVGDALLPGRFSFESGLAQIEFFCGATVILEGPAEMDLASPMLARVRSGRLRAHVPPAARGFSIDVAEFKVVDLGTEFGLSISPEGTNVHVFDGEVELHGGARNKQRLTAGQALTRTAKGSYQQSDATPERFVDIAALESRDKGQRAARFRTWKQWSEKLRQDPRLIAYYSFDDRSGWQRRLRCSIEPANSELDGAIVGARRMDGRWPSKSGLEFKQPGDRVRVNIPGEYGSVTFACWVKIDSMDRRYNSLFLTDGYEPGEPHWQILGTGRLSFSRRIEQLDLIELDQRSTVSPPFWKPFMSGKWLHLASTFQKETKSVVHYLNGTVLSQTTIQDALAEPTTRIGTASIANWSLPRPPAETAIRNLNGSIDEFAIFSIALTEDEVKEMYRNGKP